MIYPGEYAAFGGPTLGFAAATVTGGVARDARFVRTWLKLSDVFGSVLATP